MINSWWNGVSLGDAFASQCSLVSNASKFALVNLVARLFFKLFDA